MAATVAHPPLTCTCGCATEVERLRGLLEVLVQVARNAAPEPPQVSAAEARKKRMRAAGITGVVRGG